MATNEICVGGNYKVGRRIGYGSFGEIYRGTDILTGIDVAIKVESLRRRNPHLLHESKLYRLLQGIRGVPHIYWFGIDGEFSILVMDLLGPSIEDLFERAQRQFSFKTSIMLGHQIVTRLELVHAQGIIHRDIKPHNFTIGRFDPKNPDDDSKLIYIIDFGLSKKYRDSQMSHMAYRDGRNLTGTARYVSIKTHLGVEPSRRDDLESALYVLLYFLRGGLPWQGLRAQTKKEKYDLIMEKKIEISIESLCEGLPKEIAEIVTYIRSLKYSEKPDYSFIKSKLSAILLRRNLSMDFIFDWNSPTFTHTCPSVHIQRVSKGEDAFGFMTTHAPIIQTISKEGQSIRHIRSNVNERMKEVERKDSISVKRQDDKRCIEETGNGIECKDVATQVKHRHYTNGPNPTRGNRGEQSRRKTVDENPIQSYHVESQSESQQSSDIHTKQHDRYLPAGRLTLEPPYSNRHQTVHVTKLPRNLDRMSYIKQPSYDYYSQQPKSLCPNLHPTHTAIDKEQKMEDLQNHYCDDISNKITKDLPKPNDSKNISRRSSGLNRFSSVTGESRVSRLSFIKNIALTPFSQQNTKSTPRIEKGESEMRETLPIPEHLPRERLKVFQKPSVAWSAASAMASYLGLRKNRSELLSSGQPQIREEHFPKSTKPYNGPTTEWLQNEVISSTIHQPIDQQFYQCKKTTLKSHEISIEKNDVERDGNDVIDSKISQSMDLHQISEETVQIVEDEISAINSNSSLNLKIQSDESVCGSDVEKPKIDSFDSPSPMWSSHHNHSHKLLSRKHSPQLLSPDPFSPNKAYCQNRRSSKETLKEDFSKECSGMFTIQNPETNKQRIHPLILQPTLQSSPVV